MANGVNIICFALNKLRVFRLEAEINSTFLRFCVTNFNEVVFFETIINTFLSKFIEQA